jgi:hypothetical protein
MDGSHRQLTTQPTDFWLARGAIFVIVMLQIGIVNDLSVGPRWLAPSLELALLIPLSLATAWTQKRARGASTDAQWAGIGRHRRMVRRLAFVLTAICTLINFGALARLIAAIFAGHAGSGKTLLLDFSLHDCDSGITSGGHSELSSRLARIQNGIVWW